MLAFPSIKTVATSGCEDQSEPKGHMKAGSRLDLATGR